MAREKYAKETNIHIHECGLVVCASEPWLGFSPDGICIKNFQPNKLLEIKCPFDLQDIKDDTLLKKCKFLCLLNNDIVLRKKHQYYAQVQMGMVLLNLTKCDFVIYSNMSDSIKIIAVPFDEKYVSEMLSTLKRKYFENMLHEICKNSRVL